jgi:hypothetical protein
MEASTRSFIDTFESKVRQLMIDLVEYVRGIDTLRSPNPAVRTGGAIPLGNAGLHTSNSSTVYLEKNVNGYPILPIPIPSSSWKKPAWDKLFTDYLGQQYHLACGGKTKHIPYKSISAKQQDFIAPRYLPPKTTFRPPRNIVIEEMKSIFEHLVQRQQKYGPEDTFRFKSIQHNRNTVPARYGEMDSPGPSPGPNPSPGPGPNISPATSPAPGPGPGPATTLSMMRPGTRANRAKVGNSATGPDASPLPSPADAGTENMNTDTTRPKPRMKKKKQGNDGAGPDPGPATGFIPTMITVNQETMIRLNEMGVPPHIASNGPNDGVPLYTVDAKKYQKEFTAIEKEKSILDPNIDPTLQH